MKSSMAECISISKVEHWIIYFIKLIKILNPPQTFANSY